MKKVFSIIAVAVVATMFASCGQSAEEKAKQEADATRKADSIVKAMEASLGTVVSEATAVDSTKAAETATPAAEEAKK